MERFLIIIVTSVVFIAIVSMWEKRLVWPHSGPEPGPSFPDINGYAAVHVDQALQAGFEPLVWTRNMQGDLYKMSYAFLVSPDRECLAMIGVGTLASIPVAGTWIYSRTVGDVLSYTTDCHKGTEIDLSGKTKCQLVMQVTFADLVNKHREWLHSRGLMPDPYPAGGEIDAQRNMYIVHRKSLQAKGIIRYTDATETWWRYSFLGAIRLSIVSYAILMVRTLTFGKFPRTA